LTMNRVSVYGHACSDSTSPAATPKSSRGYARRRRATADVRIYKPSVYLPPQLRVESSAARYTHAYVSCQCARLPKWEENRCLRHGEIVGVGDLVGAHESGVEDVAGGEILAVGRPVLALHLALCALLASEPIRRGRVFIGLRL
jgi:hypothetical protein